MSNAKNIIQYIAEDNLDGALTAFKGAMSEKLVEQIDTRTVQIQQEIAEQYPDIFDSEADKDFVSMHTGDVEDPEGTAEDPAEMIEPEEGHRDADYDDDEDIEVNEEYYYEV